MRNALQEVIGNKASLQNALKNRSLEQLPGFNSINSGAKKRKLTVPNKHSKGKVKKAQNKSK